MTAPEILANNDGHLVATWHNMFFEVAWAEASLESQPMIDRELKKLMERNPDGVGYILSLPTRVPIPKGAVREKITERLRGLKAGEMLGIAIVFGSGGFWSSAARSVAAGISLAARLKFPMKLFSSDDDAAAWMLDLASRGNWSIPELLDALVELKAQAEQGAEHASPSPAGS